MEESIKLPVSGGKSIPADQYSPLTLAYLGDAVFELIIRERLVSKANMPANKLHKKAVDYVSAEAQSFMLDAIFEMLTEKEQKMYKRGHNAKPHTMAKNASASDYLKATGFEALLGYLYLNGEMSRIDEITGAAIAAREKQTLKDRNPETTVF